MCTANIITATLKDNLKKKKRALKDCDFNKGFLVFANLHTSHDALTYPFRTDGDRYVDGAI